jgi:dGTP triphosphohydrolase
MANFVACQTLGEMSTPSKAEQYTTRLTHSLGIRCIGRDNTAQIRRNLTSAL